MRTVSPHRLQQPLLRVAFGAALSLVVCLGVDAQPGGPCLVTPPTAPSGELSYSARADRCEGVLPRYVGYGDNIELVGYGAGDVDTAIPIVQVLVPEAAGAVDSLTVRALSLTARKRYQMDRTLAGRGHYEWPLGLLRQAVSSPDIKLDPATMGLVACTNRCANRPDTVFIPVLVARAASVARPALTLKLRADVFATNVRARLQPRDGGSAIEPHLGRMELSPDDLSSVSLPTGLRPGEYRLEVRATNSQTMQQMSSLRVRIVVP